MRLRKRRVIHLISGLFAGGAETSLYRLLAKMNPEKFESIVVSLVEIGPIGEKIKALGIPVYSLGMRRGYPSLPGFFKLVQLLRRKSPDILQTWLYHADLLGTIAARMTGISNVLWNVRASNMDMARYPYLSSLTVKACALLSGLPRAVVVNSHAGETFHLKIGYHPRKWVRIPNGIDVQEFRPDETARLDVRRELGLDPEALVIGLVARFDPMKDHKNFFEATRRLRQTYPSAYFLLVGQGIHAGNVALSNMMTRANLSSAGIYLLGERSDVPRLTAALDIATCSSYSEGFPNVVAEAMACGVPCVVTNAGDATTIVGDTGIVVAPKDAEGLAAGLQKMIEIGAETRGRLGRAARKRIEQNYSLDHVVAQYQNLYLPLLNN